MSKEEKLYDEETESNIEKIKRKRRKVSGIERKLSQNEVIVSTTDKKGNILSCNNEFVKISGFSEEELIGKPHHKIGHPDMPSEAFRDMWETIKSGMPWQGYVKNRCKYGDHYWVFATVTPTETGYKSVRYPISDLKKAEMDKLYKEMREDPRKYALHKCRVYKKGLNLFFGKLINRINSYSLRTKVILPLVVAAIIGGGNLYLMSTSLEKEVLTQSGKANAESLIETARNARAFYSQEIIPKGKEAGLEITHDFEENPHGIPLPASLMRSLGEMSKGENASELKLYSRHPFSFNNSRTDEFEKEALKWLEDNPDESYYRIEEQDGKTVFRLAQADVMINETCINCHNSHPNSTKTDWEVGDVRGAITATIPLSSMQSNINNTFNKSAIVNIAIGLFFFVLIVVGMNSVVNKIRRINEVNKKIANGYLNTDIHGIRDTDELGELAGSSMKSRNQLAELASELKHSSKELEQTFEEVNHKTVEVVNGSNEIASSSEQSAAAVEEISASIAEIAEHGQKVHDLSEEAGHTAEEGSNAVYTAAEKTNEVAQVVEASEQELQKLKEDSDEIVNIVSTISDIADRTNLLALNAAIEAARAGEAGRGFAVVADEVRSLANSTSNEVDNIKSLIERIMEQISNTSSQINQTVSKVEENVQTSQEAAESISKIREKTTEVTNSVDEIRRILEDQKAASDDVANVAQGVADQSRQGIELSQDTQKSIKQISVITRKFDELASRYKIFD